MKENELRAAQIKRLQDNLSSIRKIAGWSTKDLGDKIGVSSQTIRNLEKGAKDGVEMNFTQYIAIRAVIDCEIEENKDNQVLASVVDILLDKADELSEEKYVEVKNSINTVAAAAAGGITGAALATTYSGILSTIGFAVLGPVGGPIAGIVVGGIAGATGVVGAVKGSKWLKKILNKNKE